MGLKTVLNTSKISSGISVHALPYCLYILFDVGSDQIFAWKAGYHVNVDSLLWCLQYLDPRLNFKYPESSLCTWRSTHWCVQCLDPRLYVGVPGACGVPLVAPVNPGVIWSLFRCPLYIATVQQFTRAYWSPGILGGYSWDTLSCID